jgi:hypothetical protein
MTVVVCPSCNKKLRPPDRLAGRQMICSRCAEIFVLPDELTEPEEDLPAPEPAAPVSEERPLPVPARLGIAALLLGAASILVLCLPLIGGYASIGLSGAGLLLALGGLLLVRVEGEEEMGQAFARGVGIWGSFGARTRDYPLAGVGACLLAMILALLPSLFG